MTSFKKVWLPLMASLVLATGSAAVTAAPPDGGFHGPGEQGVMAENFLAQAGEKLNLSADQKADIGKLIEDSRKAGDELRQSMRAAMQAERAAVHQRAKPKTLRKLAYKSADARVDLMVHGLELEEKINKVLTDEQRQQLEKMRAERMARMHERMEKRRQRMEQDKQ